jgi:hypothetical protein
VGSIPEDLLALNGVSAASAQAQAVLSRFRHPFGYGEGPAAKASEITGEMLLDVGSVYVGATSGLRGILPTPSAARKLEGVPLEPHVSFGEGGRVEEAFARIEKKNLGGGSVTDSAARRLIQTLDAKEDDVAGHIIAKRLGGSGKGEDCLVFPQSRVLNNGKFKSFEAGIARDVREGNQVDVHVRLLYPSLASKRPSALIYRVFVNSRAPRVGHFINE